MIFNVLIEIILLIIIAFTKIEEFFLKRSKTASDVLLLKKQIN